MAIGDFGLLSKFISFAISHVKKYLFSNISRKHATTKLSFIFGKIRLNESEIRRFLFKNVTADTLPSYKTEPSVYTARVPPPRAPWCGPVTVGKMRTTCFEPYQAYWLELFFDNRKCNKIRLANRLTTRSRFGDAAHGQPVHKSLREKKGNSSQVCYIYNRTLPQEGAKPNNKTKEELLWNIIPQSALM